MYTVKFYRSTGKMSIAVSARTRSFFFTNERDQDKVSKERTDIINQMQLTHVGFWIRYDYAEGIGGTVAVGLNGSPFNPDYALMRWTDTESDALESVRHIGFTGTSGSYLDYGLNCVLLDTTPNPFTASQLTPAIQPQVQQPGGQQQQQSFGASPNGFVSNLNRVNPNAFGQQQQQQQFLSNQNHVYNTVQQLANGGMVGPGQLQQLNAGFNSLNQQQQQQQQQLASGAAANQFLGANQYAGLQHQYGAAQSYASGQFGAPSAFNAPQIPPATTEPTVIIEPVLNNQYLTKLQRMLPTIFSEFQRGEIEKTVENNPISRYANRGKRVNAEEDRDQEGEG